MIYMGPPPNVIHFNAAISACEASGYWEGALSKTDIDEYCDFDLTWFGESFAQQCKYPIMNNYEIS